MTSRKLVRGVSAWLFGLATTFFLIAMWGRAVVVDVGALEEATAHLADSSAVVDLLTGWLEDELVEADVPPVTSEMIVEEVMTGSSMAAAMQQFTGEFVAAAANPSPRAAVVDVSRLLTPAVPEIDAALDAAGVSTAETRIADVVADIDPLVVRGSGSEPYVGPESTAAGRLGTAAVLALGLMGLTGWISVASSDDRFGQVRSLLNRVALGALSFAVLLKVGSWLLDPRGGRAPISESASVLANSKWLFVVALGLVAAGGAALVWVVRRYLRREEGSPPPGESPRPQQERQPIRSG